MKVLSVVGARPQFIKLAPVARALTEGNHEHVIVHTGQHYDAGMSDVFFEGLSIPLPDVHLGIGSGSHGVQTGGMLVGLDPVFDLYAPDWVLVYGDTNSTIAGALSAVKLHIRLAHLESGLRSFNRRMPEEHNRVMTDHAADLCLAPTQIAMEHLTHEGLADRAVLVGDVMADVCLLTRDEVVGRSPVLPSGVDADSPYLVATIHRPDNTDDMQRLSAVVTRLGQLPVPVVLLAHPRLVAKANEAGVDLAQGAVRVAAPLPYAEMINAVARSAGVVTDSGGLQKEAFLLRVPCTTLRTETEWPETLADGWNVLDPELDRLRGIAVRNPPTGSQGAPFGEGHAARTVVSVLAGRR
jgi:UDP-N-acetylglucosamine 2-epimerase (non-hydrolysing)